MKSNLLRFIAVALFFCILPSVRTAAQPYTKKELKELVTELREQLKKEEDGRRRDLKDLNEEIDRLKKIIEKYYVELYGPKPIGGPDPMIGKEPDEPIVVQPGAGAGPAPPPPNAARTVELEERIRRLNREIAELRGDNAQLKRDLDTALVKITTLETALAAEQEKYNRLYDQYELLDKQLTCLADAVAEKRQLIRIAEPELQEARTKYDKFKNSINGSSALAKTEEDQLLTDIFDIYDRYGAEERSTTCGSITYEYTLDYLAAEDHLVITSILAIDPRHLLDRYGSSLDQRTANSNADLLFHIGQVFRLGDYTERARAKTLSDLLPSILVAGANVNISDSTSTRIMSQYQSIAKRYADKDYVGVISEYNRYQRLEGEETMQRNALAIAQARTCTGIVLLFNLGDVNKSYPLTNVASWLRETGLNDQQSAGRQLLLSVIELRQPDGQPFPSESLVHQWQQRAAYALSKDYQPKTKNLNDRL